MPNTSSDSFGRPTSLGRMFAILRARWKSVVTVMLSVVVLVFGVCLIIPEKYTASAVVVIDLKSPDLVSGSFSPGLMLPTYMGTQVEMLQSERVILSALRSLKVLDSPEIRQKWQEQTGGSGDYGAWAADVFSRKLDIRPGRDSNLIEVRYVWPDPAFASAMANAIVKAYLETSLALQTEPARQYNALFDERAKALRAQLEEAQDKLSAYQRKSGLIATDERFDIENSRLAELSSQLVALQAVAAESQNRQNQASSKSDRLQEVVLNPLVSSLTAEVATQEARLSELSSRLGSNHPELSQQRARLAQLKAKLQTATAQVTGTLGVNNTVNQNRLNELQTALAQQRSTVLKLKSVRDGASVLQRDVENAQAAFQNATARTQQATLGAENNQTNVLILKTATVPATPSFPKWPLIVIVAEFVGVLLGIAWALTRERLDERLRVPDDAMSFGLPLMAVLPDHRREAKRSLGMSGARALLGRKSIAA